MTLKEWRTIKKWSQSHFARTLSKKTGETFYQSHVQSWENGGTPNAKTADAIKKITGGKVTADSYGKADAS